ASLANQLDGYVVTNDSDFFLLDLKKGLITITSLCDSIKQSQPYCTIYKQQNLSQYLGIFPDLLPIIALVLGNDYSVDCYRLQLLSLMGIQPRDKIDVKIEHIVKYLKGAVSVDRLLQTLCCGNEEMRSQLSKELEEYNVHQFDGLSQEYIGYFETQQKETAARNFFDSKNKLKNFIDQLVRAGLIDACVLDLLNYRTHFVNVQCELIAKRCTSVCSSVLRRYLYGMLLKQDEIVVDYTRSGQKYRPKMVRPSNDLPSLNELWSRSEEERQSFFLDLLDIPLEGRGAIISPAHQSSLFLITLQYFKQVHSTSEEQTNTFLEMHLILRNGNRCCDVPHLDQVLLHVYSSFHTVFYYINMINTLLGEPFVTPKASQLMSGSMFQSLCQRGNKDFEANHAKEDLTDLETYQNFILPNMMDKVQPRSSSKKNHQHHYHHHRHHQGLKNSQLSNDALPRKPASQSGSKKSTFPSTNKKPSAQASNKKPSNRFQLLSISDDE
uniref:Uncharacterized protein n=2 Tax=Clytia hemisphaerica TaxID=252671 RepID=A0A7M5XAR0_9CNID